MLVLTYSHQLGFKKKNFFEVMVDIQKAVYIYVYSLISLEISISCILEAIYPINIYHLQKFSPRFLVIYSYDKNT